jgi:SAM-dependent methyltransferase
MEPRHETWNSFWGQLLRVDFFQGQWDMYRKVADSRAEWLEQTFQLSPEKPVLSCACGEGGIELALARRGYTVTGIDNCTPFIHFARSQAAEGGLENAAFLSADLCSDTPLPGNFNVVYCFDTIGLLGDESELKLLRKMVAALAPGGLLLIDCPQRDAQSSSRLWWRKNDGYLLIETRWDAKTGILHLEPLFVSADAELVDLVDPYDKSRNEHSGVLRYLYTPDELTRLVNQAGLYAQQIGHQRKGYYMLAARAAG